MRRLSALLATTLMFGTVAATAAEVQQCARPPEKNAFDVAGLKSQLMVTAISCHTEDKYNAFILRFRPDLQKQEKALNTYFSRAFGRRGQKEHDDYITSLANAQSQDGIKSGTAFCKQKLGMFDEVMALPNGTGLPGFAATKTLAQPIALSECPAAPVHATRTASAATPRKH